MSHVHRPEVRAVTRLTTTRLTPARFRDGGSPPLNELVFGHLHPPTAGRNLAEDLRQSRETSRKPGRLTPAGFAAGLVTSDRRPPIRPVHPNPHDPARGLHQVHQTSNR